MTWNKREAWNSNYNTSIILRVWAKAKLHTDLHSYLDAAISLPLYLRKYSPINRVLGRRILEEFREP